MAKVKIEIEAEPEVLNFLLGDLHALADKTSGGAWKDEHALKMNRIRTGYNDIAGQLIDQGFSG